MRRAVRRRLRCRKATKPRVVVRALAPESFALHEPDPALLGGLGRGHKLANGIEDAGDGPVVGGEFAFQLVELTGQFAVGGQQSTQSHERSHHLDVDLDGLLATEDG